MDNEEKNSSVDFCATMVDVGVHSHDFPITKLLFEEVENKNSSVTSEEADKDESES